MKVTSHRELDAWNVSMEIAESVYALARQMPKQEEFRLTSQMIRAAISIPANIAEGHARATITQREYDGRIERAGAERGERR